MAKVTLGEVAIESRETCKGDKSSFPTVGLEHITPEEIRLSHWDNGSDNTFTKRFHEGDILFGRRRAYLKKAAIAPFEGICSGDITVIRAIPDKIAPRLLPFIIQNDDFFDYAVGRSAGSLSPRVKWEHLKNYEFDLPEMNKQHELADVLWAIEDTRTAYQELATATEELVKSRFVEMFGDLETNPKDWKKTTFDDVSVKITDGEHATVPRVSDGYVFLNARNVLKAGKIDLAGVTFISEDNHNRIYKRCNPEPGDILLTTTGTIGNVAIVPEMEPFSMDRGITLIKQDRNIINGTFLAVAMRMESLQMHMRNGIHASAIGHLFMNKVKALPIFVPPITLQNQFADFVQLADKSKVTLQKSVDSLQKLKTESMHKYLS